MMAGRANLHRTTVSLTAEQYQWLRKRAYAQVTTIAAVLRDVVEEARRLDQPQESLPLS